MCQAEFPLESSEITFHSQSSPTDWQPAVGAIRVQWRKWKSSECKIHLLASIFQTWTGPFIISRWEDTTIIELADKWGSSCVDNVHMYSKLWQRNRGIHPPCLAFSLCPCAVQPQNSLVTSVCNPHGSLTWATQGILHFMAHWLIGSGRHVSWEATKTFSAFEHIIPAGFCSHILFFFFQSRG